MSWLKLINYECYSEWEGRVELLKYWLEDIITI
jgi:hypothetical protein